MLGEKISTVNGKVTATRVLPGEIPKIETSFQGAGKLLGVDTNDIGTYTSFLRSSGTFLGEGQGISVTKEGEVAKWRGFGIGKPTGKGIGAKYRYAISYESESAKLSRLNDFILVGEWEVDADGNCSGGAWEWK